MKFFWLCIFIFTFSYVEINASENNAIQLHNLSNIPPEVKIDFDALLPFTGKLSGSRINELQESFELKDSNIDHQHNNEESNQFEWYAEEGTGVRGGGTGILIMSESEDSANAPVHVKLLDLYRSENLSENIRFFRIDPTLLNIKGSSEEDTATKVYSLIKDRIKKKFPSLIEPLEKIESDLPFSKWVPIVSEIPIVHDYIGRVQLMNDEKHVQIAYRYYNKISYNEVYYNLMDGINRAALKLHEYIYTLSNNKSSIHSQSLISYFFSEDINLTDKVPKDIMESLIYLGIVIPLYQILDSSKTFKVITEKNKGDLLCGQIKNIAVNKDQSLTFSLFYSKDKKILSSNDLLSDLGDLKLDQEIKYKIMNKQSIATFMSGFYSVKQKLSSNYPLYQFPAQSSLMDLMCVQNSNYNKILYLELGIFIETKFNEIALKNADLEAQYFTAQRDYVLTSLKAESLERSLDLITVKNKFKLLEYYLINSKSEQNFSKITSMVSNTNKKTESLMIEFNELDAEIDNWISVKFRSLIH